MSVGVKYGLKLASNLVLARLLLPDAFGLVAVVYAIISGIEALTDSGANASMIRSHRTDDVWLDTLWSVQVSRGVLLTLILFLASFPVSWFYEEPRLQPMIAVASLINLFSNLASTSSIFAVRNLQLKKYSLIEIASLLVGYALMIPLAYYLRSAWALLAGGIIMTGMATTLGWLLLPRRTHRFRFERTAFFELFGFGKWVLLSSLLGFLIYQGDRLIIGKSVGMHGLGIYFIALTWASSLIELTSRIIDRLYLPVVSEFRRSDGNAVRATALRKHIFESLVIPFAFVCGASSSIIHLLYPDRLWDAGPVLQILIVGAWFNIVEIVYNDQFLSENRPNRRSIAQLMSMIFIAAAVVLFANDTTTMEITLVFVLGTSIRGIALMAMYHWNNPRNVMTEASLFLMFLGASYIISKVADHLLASYSPIVTLMMLFCVLLAPGVLVLMRALRQVFSYMPGTA